MSTQVNMHEAKTSLSRLVERALAGEEVVIARNGEPLVRLVPVPKPKKQRIPGRSKGKIWIAPDCFDPMYRGGGLFFARAALCHRCEGVGMESHPRATRRNRLVSC
jgi:prevent-host-death family protein